MMIAPRCRVTVFLAVAALSLAACSKEEPVKPEPPAAKAPVVVPVEIVSTTGDDVAETVRREVVRARADKRDLLVYVGATWCEPCQYFHKAAAAGQLNATFPGLRLVEFDLDRDKEALERAGYSSKMIPLFAVPRDDGSGSGEQIEGSIKGPGAVQQIAPRLKELLSKNH
jgi:thiol-disulfide isomerase/thioredoxin